MAVPLSGISTGALLNNNVSAGFSSLAEQSLAKFAGSGGQQSQMFQQAALGSPANAEFLNTLNQSLAPAQGQVAGALQLVNNYKVRKQQEAVLQQQQLATLLAAQGAAGGALGNLANPNAIGGGILGQLQSLVGQQTGVAPATPVAAGAAGGGDVAQMLTQLIAALSAMTAQPGAPVQ